MSTRQGACEARGRGPGTGRGEAGLCGGPICGYQWGVCVSLLQNGRGHVTSTVGFSALLSASRQVTPGRWFCSEGAHGTVTLSPTTG